MTVKKHKSVLIERIREFVEKGNSYAYLEIPMLPELLFILDGTKSGYQQFVLKIEYEDSQYFCHHSLELNHEIAMSDNLSERLDEFLKQLNDSICATTRAIKLLETIGFEL